MIVNERLLAVFKEELDITKKTSGPECEQFCEEFRALSQTVPFKWFFKDINEHKDDRERFWRALNVYLTLCIRVGMRLEREGGKILLEPEHEP